MSIKNIGAAWPWPEVSDARKRGDTSWFESTEDRHDYSLGVLPPIYFPGGFFMGEAADADERDVAIFSAWVCANGRYFVREIPRDNRVSSSCGIWTWVGCELPCAATAGGSGR